MEIAEDFKNQQARAHGHYLRSYLALNKGDYKKNNLQLLKQLEIYENIERTGQDNNIHNKINLVLNNLG